MNTTSREGAFIQEVRQMLAASVSQIHRDRFQINATFDGYEISQDGEVIVTIQGPQFGLASKIVRLLRDEAALAQIGASS